jgi:hypothetical protein
MSAKACPVLMIALAVGFVLTRRRLNAAEAELRLLRRVSPAAGTLGPPPSTTAAPPAGMTSGVQAATSGMALPEDFSAWEGAVPPMDS